MLSASCLVLGFRVEINLVLGALEEVEEHAAEVVGVRVGEAQLVRDPVQEQVPPLRVQVPRQLHEYLHARPAHRVLVRPLVQRDGVLRRVQHQRVDQRHVVPGFEFRGSVFGFRGSGSGFGV